MICQTLLENNDNIYAISAILSNAAIVFQVFKFLYHWIKMYHPNLFKLIVFLAPKSLSYGI